MKSDFMKSFEMIYKHLLFKHIMDQTINWIINFHHKLFFNNEVDIFFKIQIHQIIDY